MFHCQQGPRILVANTKQAFNAEREAVNAEREAQFQKWFASQSVADIQKINDARAWLRKRGVIKRGLTPLMDSRKISKRTGYLMFVSPKMAGQGKATPEVMKQVGAEWKALSADERAVCFPGTYLDKPNVLLITLYSPGTRRPKPGTASRPTCNSFPKQRNATVRHWRRRLHVKMSFVTRGYCRGLS